MQRNHTPARWAPRQTLILALVAAFVTLHGNAAEPEKKFPPWDRAALDLGGYLAAFDSSLTFGINGAAGVSISGEDLLGQDSSLFVLFADGYYRIGQKKRHQVGLSYSAFHRDASGTLTEEIKIDDVVLAPGTQIETVFNFDIIQATYSYAIFQDERIRIGLGLGAYITPIKYGIDIVSPGDDRSLNERDITVPLPALSLQGEVRLLPKPSLVGAINGMYLRFPNFQGSLLSANVGVEYRPWRRFGLGLAYNSMSVNVESKSSSNDYPGADFVGGINVDYAGLILYGKFAF